MCQPKPGLRCADHAYQALKRARLNAQLASAEQKEQAVATLTRAETEYLLTDEGLRSLSPQTRPYYQGIANERKRAAAYLANSEDAIESMYAHAVAQEIERISQQVEDPADAEAIQQEIARKIPEYQEDVDASLDARYRLMNQMVEDINAGKEMDDEDFIEIMDTIANEKVGRALIDLGEENAPMPDIPVLMDDYEDESEDSEEDERDDADEYPDEIYDEIGGISIGLSPAVSSAAAFGLLEDDEVEAIRASVQQENQQTQSQITEQRREKVREAFAQAEEAIDGICASQGVEVHDWKKSNPTEYDALMKSTYSEAAPDVPGERPYPYAIKKEPGVDTGDNKHLIPEDATILSPTPSPVFVYGTLRSGHGNYRNILEGATENEHTDVKMPGSRMLTHGAFPYTYDDPSGDRSVTGDLMYLDPADFRHTMDRLDMLEGTSGCLVSSSNHYNRVLRYIQTGENEYTQAWVYLSESSYESNKEHLFEVEEDDWTKWRRPSTPNRFRMHRSSE